MNRRRFLGRLAGAGALGVLAPADLLAHRSRAGNGLVIGHLSPGGGSLAGIGQAAAQGAQLAASETARTAALLGRQVGLVEASAHGVRETLPAAARLVERGASVLLGGFDAETVEALSDLAEEQGVLFLNVGWSGDEARARCRPRTFHVQPSETMRARALASWEESGGEAVPGTVVLAWDPSLARYGAGQLNDRHRVRHGTGLAAAGWPSWMGVKAAWEAYARTRGGDAAEMATFLASDRARLDGHKGIELSFRPADHQLRQPLYVASRTVGGETEVRAEVPRPSSAAEVEAEEVLDALLGPPPADGCVPGGGG